MNARAHRPRVTLPLLNLFAWALFVLLRDPVPSTQLHSQDLEEAAERSEGGMTMKLASGAPYALIADRYLYNWSTWHGGENVWVKALIVPNLPALVLLSVPAHTLNDAIKGLVPVSTRSWLFAAAFLAVASLQWRLVGLSIEAAVFRKRGSTKALAGAA